MNLRQYIAILALGTTVSLVAWVIILQAMDPFTAGPLALAIFYITLGSGLAGLLTIIGTVLRASRFPEAGAGVAVIRSFRQSVLLSVLIIVSLVFMSLEMFSSPVLLVLIGLLALIEFFFLIFQDRRSFEHPTE
ncbi:MAG: hypothetical protein WC813_02070 [Patescibacteria group bacterium]|jgi:hypothetical protein